AAHPALGYQGLSTDDVLARVDSRTQAIGLSSMFSLEWPHLHALIRELHHHFPDAPIILGGEHPTATYEYILQTCPAVTCVALGEGEETICDFGEFVEGRRLLDSIPSLAFRHNGSVVKMQNRARVRDVAALPWPGCDLVPLET